MTTFDVYGSPTLPVLELRDRVAAALGLRFTERDSLHWGIYHTATGAEAGETITVYNNVHPDVPDDAPFAEHPGTVSVVTVSAERPATARVLAGVGDLVLLEHADLGPPAPPAAPTTFRDVWGSPSLDPARVRDRLAAVLGVPFEERTMPARGGPFLVARGPDGEDVVITDNRVVIGVGGTVYDPDAPVATVVEISGPAVAAEAVRARLAGVEDLVVVHRRR